MSSLLALISGITERDEEAYSASKKIWDSIAKPLGSLGAFEEMVSEMAALKGDAFVKADKAALLVFCADNGVVNEGVSQTGPEATKSVMKALSENLSTVSFMAEGLLIDIIPVDMGVRDEEGRLCEAERNSLKEVLGPLTNDQRRDSSFRRWKDSGENIDGSYRILNRRILNGTGNILIEPAMGLYDCEKAVMAGAELVRELKELGFEIVLTGEMGIGNTTTSAAVASVLTGEKEECFVGRGAGLSSEGLSRKLSVVRDAIRRAGLCRDDVLKALSELGGLDIAALCGVFLGGAYYKLPVVIDGYISAVAALCAYRLCPLSGKAMIASHKSFENGGGRLLDYIGKRAVIDADMRLGEGSGAVMLLPLLRSALNVYNSGHDFESLGIEPYRRLS